MLFRGMIWFYKYLLECFIEMHSVFCSHSGSMCVCLCVCVCACVRDPCVHACGFVCIRMQNITFTPSHADINRQARIQGEVNNNLFHWQLFKLTVCQSSVMQSKQNASKYLESTAINSICNLSFAYAGRDLI